MAVGRLHVLTDSLSIVDAVLAAGAPVVQVRTGDEVTDRAVYELALRVAQRCARYGATCVVDDRLDVALAVSVHLGVPVGGHVGADDLPVPVARAVLGPGAPLGGTARDSATARAHQADGATYLGVGPAYPTRTKTGLPDPLGPSRIGEIARSVDLPVIAIGGVTADRVPELVAAGAHGVAVTGAVTTADPYRATRDLLAALATRTAPAA